VHLLTCVNVFIREKYAHMKSTIFWIASPCSSEKARRFGETCRLSLHSRGACHARNQQDAALKREVCCHNRHSPNYENVKSSEIPADQHLLFHILEEHCGLSECVIVIYS
jgi:hypothetical protein